MKNIRSIMPVKAFNSTLVTLYYVLLESDKSEQRDKCLKRLEQHLSEIKYVVEGTNETFSISKGDIEPYTLTNYNIALNDWFVEQMNRNTNGSNFVTIHASHPMNNSEIIFDLGLGGTGVRVLKVISKLSNDDNKALCRSVLDCEYTGLFDGNVLVGRNAKGNGINVLLPTGISPFIKCTTVRTYIYDKDNDLCGAISSNKTGMRIDDALMSTSYTLALRHGELLSKASRVLILITLSGEFDERLKEPLRGTTVALEAFKSSCEVTKWAKVMYRVDAK